MRKNSLDHLEFILILFGHFQIQVSSDSGCARIDPEIRIKKGSVWDSNRLSRGQKGTEKDKGGQQSFLQMEGGEVLLFPLLRVEIDILSDTLQERVFSCLGGVGDDGD